MSRLPVQPSLRRMAAFGVRPNRELGQNFLIDSNLLDVIARDLRGRHPGAVAAAPVGREYARPEAA